MSNCEQGTLATGCDLLIYFLGTKRRTYDDESLSAYSTRTTRARAICIRE